MTSKSSSAGSAVKADSVVERLGQGASEECSTAEKSFISILVSGADVQLYSTDSARRLLVIASWLAEVGSGLIVVPTKNGCEEAADQLKEIGVDWSKVTEEKELVDLVSNPKNYKFSVATLEAVASFAKDGGDLSTFKRVAIESVDSIADSGTLTDLEAVLSAAKSSDPQLILSASEPSLNVAALGRKFLKEPKSCSLKGTAAVEAEHSYFEVGATLLAKPQALCDIVESDPALKTLVFCNSPSDADFAEVILKKRGIPCVKLIGYVPQLKLSKALSQVQKGEVTVVVLTDVAARGVPLEDFERVINYSVPSDPEVYFHRYSTDTGSHTSKVVSLVATLDVANFHYLKKLGKLELNKGELPSQTEVLEKKITQLKAQAADKTYLTDPTIETLVDSILADKNAKEVVTLLLHNTLNLIPSLKSAAATTSTGYSEEEGESDEDSYGDRGGRGGDRGGRGERRGRDRGDRGDNRGDDRGGDRGPRRGRFESDSEGSDEGGRDYGRGPRRDRDSGNGREFDSESGEGRRERAPRRPPTPVDRNARLYVGHGSNDGLTESTLIEAITKNCGLEDGVIKKVNLRDCYSFVDVPEEIAEQVTEELSASSFKDEERFFVRRAVVLSIPRAGGEAASEEGNSEDGGDREFEASDDRDQNHDSGSDEATPTMLDPDEE